MSVTGTEAKVTVRSPVQVTVQPTYIPPFFSAFNGTATNVLRSRYANVHELKISARSKLGVYQEYAVTATSPLTENSKLVGRLTANWSTEQFDLNSTYYSDPTVGDSMTFIPKVGLPVGATLEASANASASSTDSKSSPSATVKATYAASHVAITTEASSDLENHNVNASLTLGLPHGVNGFSVGAVVRAAANSSTGNAVAVQNTEAGVHYKTADWQASIVSTANMSRLLGTFVQTVSDNTVVAAQFDAPVDGSNDRQLTLGTSHVVSKDTVIHAKTTVPTGVCAFQVSQFIQPSASKYFWGNLLPRGNLSFSMETSGKSSGLGVGSIRSYGIGFAAGEY